MNDTDQQSDFVAFLASHNLQHCAPGLRREQIDSVADLQLLNAADLQACGIAPQEATTMLAGLGKLGRRAAPPCARLGPPARSASELREILLAKRQRSEQQRTPPTPQAMDATPSNTPWAHCSREHAGCRDGKTSSGRARARNKGEMAAAAVDAPALARALRGWVASKGGTVQAQELAAFYRSPAARGLAVPKGGALKLLRPHAESAGLRFTHEPARNKWIIEVAGEPPMAPARNAAQGLGASAPAFVPGAGYGGLPPPAAARKFATVSSATRRAAERPSDAAGGAVERPRQRRPGPPPRPWTRLGREADGAFTVVSYNILSQKLLDAHKYLYKRLASPQQRLQTLQNELRRYGAQILCLQEVEPKVLEALRANGCVRASGEVQVAFAQCGGPRTDGCAILVDAGRFTIVAVNELTLTGDEEKKNAGLVVTLHDREGGSLVVACAHLLFNPRRGDVRLKQAVTLLRAVEEAKARATQPARVVVSGDFNSYPNSAVYALLARGRVASRALEERTATDETREHPSMYVDGRCVTALQPYSDVRDPVTHSLQLASAYGGPEPAFTTYLPKGTKACVDYVFAAGLAPVGRLEPPEHRALKAGLPSQWLPSDHVALVARFGPATAPRQHRRS